MTPDRICVSLGGGSLIPERIDRDAGHDLCDPVQAFCYFG